MQTWDENSYFCQFNQGPVCPAIAFEGSKEIFFCCGCQKCMEVLSYFFSSKLLVVEPYTKPNKWSKKGLLFASWISIWDYRSTTPCPAQKPLFISTGFLLLMLICFTKWQSSKSLEIHQSNTLGKGTLSPTAMFIFSLKKC